MKRTKKERQSQLLETIEETPFVTDEELAEKFNVSIQTIRLDRMELSIPELRERIKLVAKKQFNKVKALDPEEVIGEVVELNLDQDAISILDIGPEHVFSRTGIARGHHLFAQANSLAVAVINDDMALTAKSEITFKRQVRKGERVLAKAKVTRAEGDFMIVQVDSFVKRERVFHGIFTMYRSRL
ncbi:acyl-coenzyme A thioesterase PaaI-like protein [Pullulanibacillus pueri]|uniref:Transcription factor FapR n=1 Tax=Pullulanibacillus pueri TaxID=1437324 RepID=A0A8J3EL21_9BACL|nr:transcription factor FapR [Pullulanibacillus pueri]MBM7680195.1 acyl-coenzyme A thioesterase PaaI-like protein [Pullulanibacillus pueri]GGH74836.1 transcription factor FapR [Pullulanibacillus pueri]